MSSSWCSTDLESAISRPAMIRSKVVFPEPDGPSNASKPPSGTSRLTLSSAEKLPNFLETSLISMLMVALRLSLAFGQLSQGRNFLFEFSFYNQDSDRYQGQHGCNRKGLREIVLLKQLFDTQRHGVGLTRDMVGNYIDGSKFSHSAGVA